MQNPFEYSDTNKRYHTLEYENRRRYGGRVVKVPLDAGFTCPNIDGCRGRGGCTYCSSRGSGEHAGLPGTPLMEQFRAGIETSRSKWPEARYIPYFQAHTNTYAPVEVLREKFEPFIGLPGTVGLSIATRADCLPPEVLDYLEEIARRTDLTVELGLQSAFDSTGERINRCHSYAEFTAAVTELKKRGIRVCVHLIDGLPGEDRAMMLETVRRVAELPVDAVKLHLLYIIKGTVMGQEYLEGKVRELSMEEYMGIVCDQLELLPPEVVIERITGDGEEATLLAPLWSLKKRRVMNAIDKEMARRNSWQGKGRETK